MKKNSITTKLGFKTIVICSMMLLSKISYSQIYFGIELQEDEKTYVVSLKSDQTIAAPLNTTGTAQITIKLLSTDSFEVTKLTSLVPNVSWAKTVRVNQPQEATDYDYITFGLTSLGTVGLNYTKDVTLPLFSFENSSGVCPGKVEIIDNQTDAFLYPNSSRLSIRNHISIIATGGNAYLGNYQEATDCQTINTTEVAVEEFGTLSVYPNPAKEIINVRYETTSYEATSIIIYDVNGTVVFSKNDLPKVGLNQLQIALDDMSAGTYFLQIQTESGIVSKNQSFIKVGGN